MKEREESLQVLSHSSSQQQIQQISRDNREEQKNREDDSRDNIDLCFSKRTELFIENNSDCKMDSLKNIFLVQLYTNPREFYFNFKSEAIIKNMEEIEHLDTEESEQKEIKTCGDRIKCIKRIIFSFGFSISEIMKSMCCFRNRNELLYFVVYSDENPINFTQLNLFFLVFFILDLFLSSFVPLFFHSSECGKGMIWDAHYFMGSYFIIISVIEYLYAQYLYSKICQPKKCYRFFNPIKPCIFSMLAKLNVYTDVCMTVEIYKCQSLNNSRDYFLFLFVFSFIIFCLSIFYQVWCFIRMIIGRQPKSTFNPLYSNTSSLAYSSNFKCLGEFIDRFCIPYYGHLSDHFNAKKALAFIKLIVENCVQCLIQILYLIKRGGPQNAVGAQILISLSLSGFSALTSIAIIFADVTSPLSFEDYMSLLREFKHIQSTPPDNANALEDC